MASDILYTTRKVIEMASGRQGSDQVAGARFRMIAAAALVVLFWGFMAFSPSEQDFFGRHFFRFEAYPVASNSISPEGDRKAHLIFASVAYAFSFLWVYAFIICSASEKSLIKGYLYAWAESIGISFVIGASVGIVYGIGSFVMDLWKLSGHSVGQFLLIVIGLVVGLGFVGLFAAGGGGKFMADAIRFGNKYR